MSAHLSAFSSFSPHDFFNSVRSLTGFNAMYSEQVPPLGDPAVRNLAIDAGALPAGDVFYQTGSGSVDVRFDDYGPSVLCLARIHFGFTIGITGSNTGYHTLALVEHGLKDGTGQPLVLKRPLILALRSYAPLLRAPPWGDPPIYGYLALTGTGKGRYNAPLPYTAEAFIMFNKEVATRPLILALSQPVEDPRPFLVVMPVVDAIMHPAEYLTKVPASSTRGTHYTDHSAFAKSPRFLFAIHDKRSEEASDETQQSTGTDGLVPVETSTEKLYVKPGGVFLHTKLGSALRWCYYEPLEEDGRQGPAIWLSDEAMAELYRRFRALAAVRNVPESDLFLVVKKTFKYYSF